MTQMIQEVTGSINQLNEKYNSEFTVDFLEELTGVRYEDIKSEYIKELEEKEEKEGDNFYENQKEEKSVNKVSYNRFMEKTSEIIKEKDILIVPEERVVGGVFQTVFIVAKKQKEYIYGVKFECDLTKVDREVVEK